MKALGSGLGAFALDRRRGAPHHGHRRHAQRARPCVLHGAAAELAGRAGAASLHLSLTHTDGVAIAFVVAEQSPTCAPVLTREEMRAADAAALAEVSHETLVRRAGTAVAHARPRHARRCLRPTGGRRGRQGLQRRRRPGGGGGAGPPGRPGQQSSRRPNAADDAAVRPGDRRGLRDGVPRLLRGAGRARRRRGPRHRHPLGRRRRQRGGRAGRGAGRSDGDLRRAQARPAPGRGPDAVRPGRGGRHRHRIPTSAGRHGHGGRRHGGAPARAGPATGTSGSTRSAVRPGSAGHGGLGHPVHPGRHGGRAPA